ncbi:hypothetical protein ACWD7F_18665 [Streptomyces sp. NPDC005122]
MSGLSIKPVVVGSDAAEDAVTSVDLEVSYDDGVSWHRQALTDDEGSWQTQLDAPARASHVSLRVTAKQRNGGGISQSVRRAFGLK